MAAHRGLGLLLVAVVAGLVIGSLFGELLGQIVRAEWLRDLLTRGPTVGLTTPATLDLRLLSITFGIVSRGVIGIVLAIIAFRNCRPMKKVICVVGSVGAPCDEARPRLPIAALAPFDRPVSILCLASFWPWLRLAGELLRGICADFSVPSGIEEVLEGAPTPGVVAGVALAKARAVAARVGEGIVLGADTVVVIDGEALGKPADGDAACAMLRRLRGRAHEVITGVAVVDVRTGRSETTAVVTHVLMAQVSDAELEAYAASGEPLDKAGGYAIQGRGAALVAGFRGSYSNVVGLPLHATATLLRSFGVTLLDWGA